MQQINAQVVHNPVAVVEHVFPGKYQWNRRRHVGQNHQWTCRFPHAEFTVKEDRYGQSQPGAAEHDQGRIPERHPQGVPERSIAQNANVVIQADEHRINTRVQR